jgi:hypothetical protein
MGLYEKYLLPSLVDCVCRSSLIDRQRRLVVPQASGRVLELGFGSGLNLPHTTARASSRSGPLSRRRRCGRWPSRVWRLPD